MQLTYHPLFQLHLEHDYFSNGQCPALEIVPTNSSSQLLNTLSLRMVAREYGVEVFYAVHEDKGAPLQLTEEVVCLSFWLRINDPLFYNYTAGLPDEQKLFYASNLSAEGNLTWELSKKEELPVRKPFISLQGDQEAAEVTLKDALGNDLDADLGRTGNKLSVNLADLPAAHYQFNLGAISEDFLLATDGHQTKDFGLLSIFLGDLGERGKRILGDDGVDPVKYTLACSARSTRWQYNIINAAVEEETPVYRISGGEALGINFSVPKTTSIKVLPNGQKAALLTSDQAIPLRQQYDLRPILEVERGEHSYSMALPEANPRAINRAPMDDSSDEVAEELLSEIYVYL